MALQMPSDAMLATRSRYNAAVRFVDRHVESGIADQVAFFHEDGETTYRVLYEDVNRFGNLLKALGVHMEQRVLMVCFDSPEFVTTFFGAIKIGAVPVPVNTMLPSSDYEYILQDCRARVIVVEDELLPTVTAAFTSAPFVRAVMVIRRNTFVSVDNLPGTAVLDFHASLREQPTELSPAPTLYDDMGFWLYTSGSTGRPKGVVHLQHDMEVACRNYAQNILSITSDDILFSASKLFFAYGLGNGMYFSLGAGARAVLMRERATPESVCMRVEKFHPTLFFGVPTLYAAIVDWAERTGRTPDFRSVRYGVSAGEPLPAAVFHRFRHSFGVEILDGIGSTEATHIYLSNRPGDIRPGSTGKVVPGYEVRIVDEEGRAVPPGEPGQLLLKGDSLAQGYWNLHRQTCAKFQGDWYVTGDRYYRDEEGYYFYCGREDDMLKSGGIWVSPIEVEAALLEHPLVLEAAVVGGRDEYGIERPVAYVVVKAEPSTYAALAVDLRAHVRDRLAHYKCPKRFVFVDTLPKTATGKIQRFKLREAEQAMNGESAE